jgi:hypothetical protein
MYALHDQTGYIHLNGDANDCSTRGSRSCKACTCFCLFEMTPANIFIHSVQFGFTYTIGGLITFLQGCFLYTSIGVIYCELFLTGDLANEICRNWAVR